MIRTLTPIEWFNEYVDLNKLQLNIIESMADAIRNGNLEDNTYVALVQDIVSSGHGNRIPYLALEYFDYAEVDLDSYDYEYYEDVVDELEKFTSELAEIIEGELNNGIGIQFGYWDADGTYCMMAYINKDDFEEMKHEMYEWLDDENNDFFN